MGVHNRIEDMPNQHRIYPSISERLPFASAERIVHERSYTEFSSGVIHEAAARMSNHALSTARIIIGAEELLRQRVRSALRVAVATIFFAISGLISLGANVTTAFAKKVSPHRPGHSQTARAKRNLKYATASVHKRQHGKQRISHL